MLTIADTAMPAPAAITVRRRDARGQKHTSAMGTAYYDQMPAKRDITFQWAVLTGAQAAQLSALTDTPFFNVSFPDPATNQTVTAACSLLDFEANLLRTTASGTQWRGVVMRLEEQ